MQIFKFLNKLVRLLREKSTAITNDGLIQNHWYFRRPFLFVSLSFKKSGSALFFLQVLYHRVMYFYRSGMRMRVFKNTSLLFFFIIYAISLSFFLSPTHFRRRNSLLNFLFSSPHSPLSLFLTRSLSLSLSFQTVNFFVVLFFGFMQRPNSWLIFAC